MTRQFRRLRPYFRYLHQERRAIIAAISFGLVYGAASGLLVPSLTRYVFPAVFRSEGALPLRTILLFAACVPAVFLLRAAGGYLNSYYTQLAGVRILEALRLDYFRRLQVLPLSFVQNRQTGDLVSRGLADAAQLQHTLTLLANDGIKQPVTLLAAFGFLAWQAVVTDGVAVVLLSLAIIPLVIFPIRFVGRKVVKRAQQLQAHLGSATGVLTENLSAAREVRAFGLEERETTRFGRLTHALVVSQMKIVKYAQALTPAIELISATGIAITMIFAYRTGLSLESFIAVLGALYFAYEPIKKIGNLNNDLKRGVASLERIEVVLNEPAHIADPVTPATIAAWRGDVTFDRVSFAYRDGEVVLRDVDVTVPAGTVCALVGPSGAGKSTLVNLVPRFFDATAGRVLVDGHDVRELRVSDLRRHVAIVSQEPVLFNDTIYENLLLGRPEATRQEVEQAARDAYAYDFIQEFPRGFDTIVGERGAQLSGGQRQRIALARAFLRQAPILILDEATSALDSESEAAIQHALRRLMVGRTVFIIAHRFSTIRDAS
ncbi:MAG TPA: ABC transporter ATP-binding protein, partial [Candidatus Synoicihabitans sp.]|nr:ABC transporter ATP-binding protein [Candidatus Synoicihabitans sp.]